VSVIDPNTNTVVDTITVGSLPVGVAVSPTGPEAGDIYVANEGSGNVSVIDPTTNTVVDTITVGTNPFALAVSPTGPEAGDIYVANQLGGQSVSVIEP
jgi:YVTN family beta-propeller protein